MTKDFDNLEANRMEDEEKTLDLIKSSASVRERLGIEKMREEQRLL